MPVSCKQCSGPGIRQENAVQTGSARQAVVATPSEQGNSYRQIKQIYRVPACMQAPALKCAAGVTVAWTRLASAGHFVQESSAASNQTTILQVTHMPSSNTRPDIGEDIHQQQQVWLIERICWIVMALAMLAALAGLLGHGSFSAREAGSAANGFVVDYQRFERHRAQSSFRIQLAKAAIQMPLVRLRLGQDFLRNSDILRIEPAPVRALLGDTFNIYEFDALAAGTIVIHFVPTGPGSVEVEIGLDDHATLGIVQFVYP